MPHARVSLSSARCPVTTPLKGHPHLNNRGPEDLLHRSSRFRLRHPLGFFSVSDRSTFRWFTRRRPDPDPFAAALAIALRRISPRDAHLQVASGNTGL